MQNRSPTI